MRKSKTMFEVLKEFSITALSSEAKIVHIHLASGGVRLDA